MPISVLAIPLLPLAAFVLTLLFGRQIGTKVHWLPIAAVLDSFYCAHGHTVDGRSRAAVPVVGAPRRVPEVTN